MLYGLVICSGVLRSTINLIDLKHHCWCDMRRTQSVCAHPRFEPNLTWCCDTIQAIHTRMVDHSESFYISQTLSQISSIIHHRWNLNRRHPILNPPHGDCLWALADTSSVLAPFVEDGQSTGVWGLIPPRPVGRPLVLVPKPSFGVAIVTQPSSKVPIWDESTVQNLERMNRLVINKCCRFVVSFGTLGSLKSTHLNGIS